MRPLAYGFLKPLTLPNLAAALLLRDALGAVPSPGEAGCKLGQEAQVRPQTPMV